MGGLRGNFGAEGYDLVNLLFIGYDTNSLDSLDKVRMASTSSHLISTSMTTVDLRSQRPERVVKMLLNLKAVLYTNLIQPKIWLGLKNRV